MIASNVYIMNKWDALKIKDHIATNIYHAIGADCSA